MRAIGRHQANRIVNLIKQSTDVGRIIRILIRQCLHQRPSKTWGYSGCPPKRSTGPTLGNRIVSVQGFVHGSGADFQHQMRTPRRPTHLLLSVHVPM
jgi:hypothetical protein